MTLNGFMLLLFFKFSENWYSHIFCCCDKVQKRMSRANMSLELNQFRVARVSTLTSDTRRGTRPSPRPSPRASPRPSPRLSIRKNNKITPQVNKKFVFKQESSSTTNEEDTPVA